MVKVANLGEDHWIQGKKQYEKLVKDPSWLAKYSGLIIAIDKNGKYISLRKTLTILPKNNPN